MSELKKGDRVIYSEQGKKITNILSRFREGTICSINYQGLITVLWDGRKTKEQIHKDFLEKVVPNIYTSLYIDKAKREEE